MTLLTILLQSTEPENYVGTLMVLIILVCIMLVAGAFGGLLNYLGGFDTVKLKELQNNKEESSKMKTYVLLGIGAAFIVPLFLKTIDSQLLSIKEDDYFGYLVFAGICLVSAIFSSRFISSIADKILDEAKEAKKSAKASEQKVQEAGDELVAARNQIEDVQLAMDIERSVQTRGVPVPDSAKAQSELVDMATSYISQTSIPEYRERLNKKSDLGRKMGMLIIKHSLNRDELLTRYAEEGMYVAVLYAIRLQPQSNDCPFLLEAGKAAGQLYTRFIALNAVDAMVRAGVFPWDQISEVQGMVNGFRNRADRPLIRKIEDTSGLLDLTKPATP